MRDGQSTDAQWGEGLTLGIGINGVQLRGVRLEGLPSETDPLGSQVKRIDEISLDPIQFGILRLVGIKLCGVELEGLRRDLSRPGVLEVDRVRFASVKLGGLQIDQHWLSNFSQQIELVGRQVKADATPSTTSAESGTHNLSDIIYVAAFGIAGYYVASSAIQPALGHSMLRYTLNWNCQGFNFLDAFKSKLMGDAIIYNRFTKYVLTKAHLKDTESDHPTVRTIRQIILSGMSVVAGAAALGLLKSREHVAFAAAIGMTGRTIVENNSTLMAYLFSRGLAPISRALITHHGRKHAPTTI